MGRLLWCSLGDSYRENVRDTGAVRARRKSVAAALAGAVMAHPVLAAACIIRPTSSTFSHRLLDGPLLLKRACWHFLKSWHV